MIVRQLLDSKGYGTFATSPDATVYDALFQMAEVGVGALAVTQDEQLLGMISERDYARKIILKGRRSRDTKVHEIMSTPVISVTPNQSVETCMELMTEHRIRHLPVLDNGEMIGMISIGDVVKTVISEQSFIIEQLQGYIDRR